MNLEDEARKRNEFIEILKELSDSQTILETPENRSKFFKKLEALYWANASNDQFRHFYSDIFSVLALIQNKELEGDIETLGQNLEIIRHGYKSCNNNKLGEPIDISKNINKLYDHVNLEISRISYVESRIVNALLDDTISDVKTKITTLDISIKCTEDKVEKINSDIKNNQKESVAILGIFAAVVLAFTGGIAFSTSVLENINAVSPYRIIIVALIIGIVLINIIFSLFYYIDKIIYKKDAHIKPILISNIVLLILILCVISLWNYGYIEKRNINIFNNLNTLTELKDPQ